MAKTLVEMSRTQVKNALELHLNSLKRAANNAKNPLIAEIHRKEMAELTNAINTLTDAK